MFLNAFRAEDGQRGLLVILGDKVSGFDYVSRPAAYRHLHDKLIRSYLLDLLLEPKKNQDKIAKSTAGKLVGEFLAQCRATKMQTFDSVGLGTNCRFEEDFIAGTKLVHEEEPIHSAFLTLDSQRHPDPRPSMNDSAPAVVSSAKVGPIIISMVANIAGIKTAGIRLLIDLSTSVIYISKLTLPKVNPQSTEN